MPIEITQKIEKYNAFWERTNSTPLTGYSIGSYFISKRFEAAGELLTENQKIEPDMLDVAAFQDDYVRMADQWSRAEHDTIFTAAPFPGIPWIEAMLGCDVYSTGSSFVAHPTGQTLADLHLRHIVCREWFEKYLEFTRMLQELGNETFPVGQPILRGPTDIVGTILNQTDLVYALYDDPEKVVQLFHQSVDRLLDLLQEQKKHIQPFYGGYAMGFYDVWCPAECIWFQDDLNALCSPKMYEKYIYDTHKRLSKSAEYTMMHIHPASFYVIDYLLEIEALNAIQINKDVGGPSVEEMLPIFQKVQQQKNLVIWGDFDNTEIELLTRHVDPEGLSIIIFSEDPGFSER